MGIIKNTASRVGEFCDRGPIRGAHSKLKNFYDIQEEFKETGIATEELEQYGLLYDMYEKGIKDVTKVNKAEEKAEDKLNKEDKKIEYIERKMEKMREKAGPLARLKFSRIAFWNKEGKIYRNLKKRLARAKVRRKVAENTLNILEAETKTKERKLKVTEKDLKRVEKDIRKIWRKSKNEIKQTRIINMEKEKLEKIYGKEKVKEIAENMRDDNLPEEVNAQDVGRQMKKDLKNKEVTNKKENGKKENKNTLKKNIKEGIIFGENTSINRETIEAIQSKIVSDEKNNPKLAKIMKGLTPEEFMAWFGYLDDIKNYGEQEPYSKALEMVKNEDNKNNSKTLHAKRGLKAFEEYVKNSEGIDSKDLGKVDKALYELARQYNLAEQERKMAKAQKKEKELQIG